MQDPAEDGFGSAAPEPANRVEQLGPPRPLEVIARQPKLHRSAMSLLMQGGTNAYSPLVVLKYLRARPDMRERVEQWRRAGAKVLAERKSTRQAEARVHELLETARRQAERQVLARRLALSHITGLTAHERFSIQLANRLVAAAEQEPDWTKRIDMLGEAYALLDF